MARVRLATPFDLPAFSDLLQAFEPPVQAAEQPLGHIDMDVLETPEAFVIDAELPGVAKEAIHVKVDRNRVEISGQARPRAPRAGERMLCRERHEHLFYRSFVLPHEIDAERASARFADGVLELTLPKKAGGRRELPIG
ncbi:Hsp20/alpha crystallin family protein [Thiobacter aerophilum]|uniref:Hsp20/alpha crystallin family protein n=1 Tax=Thiobacter aerophilum TaxID=3121275 RepID=A0ABV0EIR5_9BURK